jgi:hypothetical protein
VGGETVLGSSPRNYVKVSSQLYHGEGVPGAYWIKHSRVPEIVLDPSKR